jgi:predicted XRE-type DNA-binding protein
MPNGKLDRKQQIQDENEPIDVTITPNCGNVFADLELPDPELLLAKAKLATKIEHLIKERRLTQSNAAKLMGLTQPNVSDLIRGRLDGFSLDRLFRCLDALDQEIDIVVRPKRVSQDAEFVGKAA